MKRSLQLLLPAVAFSAGLLAAPPIPGRIAPLKFTDTRLKNGLRVIIAEDHYAPVYSLAVAYNVGSRDERKGRTGFAHLFEHMMFKGSEKVGPGEHFYVIFTNGGSMNGTTNNDRTNYFESLPKNQLDLGLFLEADRMRSLVITKENLDNQRHAVQEERRLGIDNRPYGKTEEMIGELAYENFAYKHSVIGSMEDLNAATVDDVKEFFKTYYAPNNAVLVLIGDVNTAGALARIRKHFESIPREPPPAPVDMKEPPQEREKRARLDDKLARLPRVDLAFKLAPGNTPDSYAMGVLNTILAAGESSRLYQKLVKEKEAAVSVYGYVDERRGPSLYRITATPRPGKTPEEVESLISEEIVRLQSEPVTEKEILKARNMARRSAVQMRESSLFLAFRMADWAVYYNDPGLINTRLDKTLAVKPADVQRVARNYLKTNQRTMIHTLPAAGASKAAAAGLGK
ncbi:MAG: pitrilysin family protein [Acidobacteriota bacterium]